MIQKLNNHDHITLNLFGGEKEIEVFSVDSKYWDNETGALGEEELACLNWLIEHVNLADYKGEILAWCNREYEYIGGDPITEADLAEEVDIFAIAINLSKIPQLPDGTVFPEIGFYGWCEYMSDKGICIGFRDKKYIGIRYQDWIL